jgi:competence protein ComEC
VAQAAGVLLGLSQRIVTWHASLEPRWRIPTPPVWVALAVAAALIAAAMARGKWWRVAAGAGVAVSLALLLAHPFAPRVRVGQLEMTAIDVGQGDSILVIFPDGKRMLMDGGGIPAFGHAARTQLDTGEDIVAPYLWDREIGRVDVLALSHAHEDHIGGLPALVADFHPKELWTGATPASAAWDALRAKAEENGMFVKAMRARSRFAYGGAEIDVLAPAADYVPAEKPGNNDSLVMRIRYGARSFLLCGDAEKPVEWSMLDAHEIAHSDVLKVAHHGSKTSSTEEFLEAVNPSVAIVSAGFENSYGHPHRDVVERLERRRAEVLRTDRDGLVSVRTDGRKLEVETFYGGAEAPRGLKPAPH